MYVTASGVVLIVICMCASFVLFKRRSRMSDAGIIIPPVNALKNPVSNQTVQAVAFDTLDQDYEEIDETAMNDIPEFQNTPYENESDSEEGSHNKPTEDDEGYLHPYHSLIHPEKKPTRKDGPTNSD